MITQPELPFSLDALEPHMSARTLEFHHGKHHQSYVEKTNELIEGAELADAPLEDIIKKSRNRHEELFNNAAQVYNHNLFWQSLSPGGGGAAPARLEKRLIDRFGSFESFREKFADAGAGQFGSGWVWLVSKDGRLEITATADADTPLMEGAEPLLVCDVWEHAYYLDYQNRRPDYLEAFLDHLVNWEYADQRLAALS